MDLQKLSFFIAVFVLGAFFFLWRLERVLLRRFFFFGAPLGRRRLRARALVLFCFDFLFYALLQLLFLISFAVCYVLFIKNGFHPDAGDLGVVFVFVETLVFAVAVARRLVSSSATALLPAALHSAFLLHKWLECALKFGSGGSSKYLGYIIFNPVFGFVAAPCTSTPFYPLHLISALLPFVAFALGFFLALAFFSKKQKTLPFYL